jgi:tetratricopeptide (TPR) repeat protein
MDSVKSDVLHRSSAAMVLLLFLFWCEAASAESGRRNYEKERQAAIQEYIQGHFDKAGSLFLDAMHQAETQRDEYTIALCLIGLGDVYQSQSQFFEAEAAYRKGLSILRRIPDSDTVIAILLHNLADTQSVLHRYRDALAMLKEASRLAENAATYHEELKGLIANSFGVAYFYLGKFDKAESYFQAAIKTFSGAGSAFAADQAQSINNVAQIYRRKGQYQNAEATFKQSLALMERQLGPSHPDLTVILENLGDLYQARNRYADAEAQYRRSLAILESHKSPLPVRLIHTMHGLSKIYIERGEQAQAEAILERAAEIIGPRPEKNPEIPYVLETYSKLLKKAGKPQQAQDVHGRAARAWAKLTLTVRAQDLN